MRSAVFDESGVLREIERDPVDPGAGQVQVRVMVSGVNPTDWKAREHPGRPTVVVPNQDGSGVVESLGSGDLSVAIGDRVWLWDVAYTTGEGTAQELVTVPAEHAIVMPDHATFDNGAALGIPALTAALALASGSNQGNALFAGALANQVVLVTGGAGAVGHAAIQLARWAGATVISTVSSDHKATLAARAGATHVINYKNGNVAQEVRSISPRGVDLIVDVAISENIDSNMQIIAPSGTIVSYALPGNTTISHDIPQALAANLRVRFLLTYTVSAAEKQAAVDTVSAALAAGALPVGEEHGLPIIRYPLSEASDAHAAVRDGAVGKVLIDVTAETGQSSLPGSQT